MYRKCSSAGDDYEGLANHVDSLRNALLDVQVFAQENDTIPSDKLKLSSLASARENCVATLNEVEAFLEKHSKLRSAQSRKIAIAKFIFADINNLKQKLGNCTSLLQLGLVSLNRYVY